MPNKKRANRWPKNILEDILVYQDVSIDQLPGDVNQGIDYLLSRIHPNQRQVLLWFYKNGYMLKEMTKLEGNFTYDYICSCKEYGIKNMIRLSYVLIIGYDRFVEGYNIEKWPISLLVENLYPISYNALERVGICTVGDVLKYSKAQLMRFNRVDEITVRKIEAGLKDYGLSIKIKE